MKANTDLTVLISPQDIAGLDLAAALAPETTVERESLTIVESACTPENILVSAYTAKYDSMPITQGTYRLTLNVETELAPRALTQAVVAALPENTLWYGTSNEGHLADDAFDTRPGKAQCL